jgi:hypothetical protein
MSNFQKVFVQYVQQLERFQVTVQETHNNSTSTPVNKTKVIQVEQQNVNYYITLINNLATRVPGIGTTTAPAAVVTANVSFGIEATYQNPVLINFLSQTVQNG